MDGVGLPLVSSTRHSLGEVCEALPVNHLPQNRALRQASRLSSFPSQGLDTIVPRFASSAVDVFRYSRRTDLRSDREFVEALSKHRRPVGGGR